MNKIKDRFLKGMDKSILKSKYCRNVKDELSNLGIELSNELRLSMEEIVVRFTKLNDMIYEAEMKALSENVFKNIPMKMELFYDLFEKECMDIPIFKYYEPLQMFQRITNASNEDIITIGDKLIERAIKNKEILYCENEFMEKLVLLLNTSLTVREGEANSHSKIGWQTFTDNVIKKLNEREKPIIFVLWGNNAKAKEKFIDSSRHYILKGVHPSPLSASRGFFGCKHFSKINEILRNLSETEIDWQIENN